MLVDQVCAATGGPCTYTGREMQRTHDGMAVTAGEFDHLQDPAEVQCDEVTAGTMRIAMPDGCGRLEGAREPIRGVVTPLLDRWRDGDGQGASDEEAEQDEDDGHDTTPPTAWRRLRDRRPHCRIPVVPAY